MTSYSAGNRKKTLHTNKMLAEPLLEDDAMNRFCLFPIEHTSTFEFYLKAVASFWTVSEVDMGQDIIDFKTLSSEEKAFVTSILAFFAGADGIVNENLAANFATEVKMPEARQFYSFQQGIETIHAHMYGLMIDTIVPDKTEKMRLFNAINEVPSIKSKADWAVKWTDAKNAPFAQRLIAFACVEGIFFSASFCAIYFFKKRGKMPGLTFSNELIARDEALHRDFACHMYGFVQNKLSQDIVHDIIRSAVECECMFVDDALSNLIGMNAKMMKQYVRFVADHLLTSLGYDALYNEENPFDWMNLISLQGKTNFFEKRVGEYQKAGVMQSSSSTVNVFATDDDF